MARRNNMRGASNVRRRSAITLCVVLLLVAATVFVAFNGFGQGFMVRYMKPWSEAISLGLDLRGGVYTVYRAPRTAENSDEYDVLLTSTLRVMQDRLTTKGFTEATVTKQGDDRIRIEIPDVQDPNEILEIIGTPAHLEFKDEAGNVLMEGKDVRVAAPFYQGGNWVVSFGLTPEGAELFAEATRANLYRTISIELDGQVISKPTVNAVITGGSGLIESSSMTYEEASNLALLIQSGALPLQIEQLEMSAISATLGVEALDRALLAGMIGGILIMLFMLWRYRLPGLVANLALVIYVLLVVFLLAVFGAQLTLPGVAGIVLGIGMAVDANVLIFERFREEYKGGRSLRVSVKMGFNRAMKAIIDASITTIIAALVLYQFGTGSIQGFALALLISIGSSMITAVVISRALLNLVVDLGIRNSKYYVG
ncbi:MAG: protein translocase subunit SecD [Clostridia bacterium]|nr:protein translocase subunit SecD [Clostridia bacterium]